MKRILYILSLILLTTSCVRELNETIIEENDGKVKVDFSVLIPDALPSTKAMSTAPQVQNLYLAIFDQYGYLVEYVKATAQKATENGELYTYSANLTLSETPRIIHFIANAPASIQFGSEEEVISSLTTTLPNDAYWCRKIVNKIECVNPAATPLVPTDDTKTALSNIPMTRNFAMIEVKAAAGCPFTLDSYAVVYTPKTGTVAPYNRTSGTFVDYYGKTYAELIGTQIKYGGFVPASAQFNTLADVTLTEEPCYVYEKEAQDKNPAYIIVYGTNGGKNVYYKIDLRNNDGDYFPILRNFKYTITINSVNHAGYTSKEEAAEFGASSDLSSSRETESFTNISDGDVRLTVGYTDKVLVTEDNVPLTYKFDAIKSGVTLNNITITVNNDYDEKGAALTGIGETENEIGNTITKSSPVSGTEYTLIVDPATMGLQQKTQSIVLVGEYQYTENNQTITKTIQRKVTYTLRPPYEMEIKCVPGSIPVAMGTAFDVEITIPDGIGESLFPLEFILEANDLSMTPNNDNMPVATGKSNMTNKSAFWFTKTLTLEQYNLLTADSNGKKTFACHFKTNKTHEDEDVTLIYASNPYFRAYVIDIFPTSTGLQTYDVDDLTYFEAQYFSELKFNPDPIAIGENKPVTFSFKMSAKPTQGNVTVTLINLDKADNENDLTFVSAANGKAVYTFTPTAANTTLSFDLVTTSADGQPEVKLEAHNFVSASEDAEREWMQFNGRFTDNTLPEEAGALVDYEFSIPDYTDGMEVTITMVGLEPADGNTGLTSYGNGKYTYKPTSAGSKTLHLKTTAAGQNTCSITLEAYGYETETKEIKQQDISRVEIDQLVITFLWNHGNAQDTDSFKEDDFNITISKGTINIGSLKATRTGSNRNYTYTVTMNNVIIEGAEANSDIRISYIKQGGGSSTYTYSATTNVETLAKNKTLKLEEE